MDNRVFILGNAFEWTQFAAVLLTGLAAGLFYGYECSVVKGLGNLGDEAYLSGLRSINRVILNPAFFASFMGSLVVLPVACWLAYGQDAGTSFWLLAAATLVYGIGVFGVTVACNVPLNDKLAAFPAETATKSEMAAMRSLFEASWNRYQSIRTVAAIVAFALTILSLFKGR